MHPNGGSNAGRIPENVSTDDSVNTCSNHPQLHTEECDGNCERRNLTDVEVGVINEEYEWARAGMNMSAVQMDVFNMNLQISSLIQYLLENGIVDREALDEAYGKYKIEYMKDIRETVSPQLREAQLQALVPKKPGIIGPHGERLG